MSSTSTCCIRPDVPMNMVFSMLKSHAILHSPPYDISSIISDYCRFDGVRVHITIKHARRDVVIDQPSIVEHIVRTTVGTFQNHRLQRRPPSLGSRFGSLSVGSRPSFGSPFDSLPAGSRPLDFAMLDVSPPVSSHSTGKQCCICLETIFSNDMETLVCAHSFHRSCISRWVRQTSNCPECRTPI